MSFLNVHQLVELQDQYSNSYKRSPTGARGWVRGRREILDHKPEVYIEWDKSHWRYHGERDGWSFEHHFRPVDQELAQFFEAEDGLLDVAVSRPAPREACPHCGGVHDPLDARQEDFLEKLLGAQEAAIDSDAFFIITLKPRDLDGGVVYESDIYLGSLTDQAADVIEAQIIHTAAQLYTADVQRTVKEIEGDSR